MAHKIPKWVPHYGAQDSQVCSGSAPACSPSAQVYLPSAQFKAAGAHVRRLEQNQRKGNLIPSLWVSLCPMQIP